MRVEFDVNGTPAPQGSKKGFVVGGRAVLVESSKKVKPWRSDVRDAARAAHDGAPMSGGISVTLDFRMPRITSLPKTKPAPPHTKRPDLDKLVRSTLDALTSSGIYGDDNQVVSLQTSKRYARVDEAPGCRVLIWTVEP